MSDAKGELWAGLFQMRKEEIFMPEWTNQDSLRVLSALASAFHVGQLEPHQGMEETELREFYSIKSDAEYKDFFKRVRGGCQQIEVLVDPERFTADSAYILGPVAGHPADLCPTGLCRATDQVGYFRCFINCWLDYVTRALNQRGPEAMIDVCFSLPQQVMEKLLLRYPDAGIESCKEPPPPLSRDEYFWQLPLAQYEQILRDLTGDILAAF